MFTGTSNLLSITAMSLMFLTPWKLSKNFLYNLTVTSALRVSSTPVDYKKGKSVPLQARGTQRLPESYGSKIMWQ